jgi:hypothetical protein
MNLINKIKLSENFLAYSFLPNILKINNHQLISQILNNHKEKESEDILDFKYNYYKILYFTELNFIFEYIQDVVKTEMSKSFYQYKTYPTSIILNKNEYTYKHSTIDWYNLNNSPDFNCIVCLNDLKEKNYLILDFKNGKEINSYKILLEKNKFIIFNSELPYFITQNKNEETNVNLFFAFQSL